MAQAFRPAFKLRGDSRFSARGTVPRYEHHEIANQDSGCIGDVGAGPSFFSPLTIGWAGSPSLCESLRVWGAPLLAVFARGGYPQLSNFAVERFYPRRERFGS